MADNVSIKDAAGSTRTMAAVDISGKLVPRHFASSSPVASDAATPQAIASTANNNATSVKASSGIVFGLYVYNGHASAVRYIKLYDKASAPAPASDSALIVAVFPVAAGQARNVSIPEGIPFATGIAYAIVGGASATDNTSISANDILGVLTYK